MNELFAKDFINLQAEIGTMPKDKSGYGYKYTDLDTIIKNIKPLLKAHNLAFMQLLRTIKEADGKETTGLETMVIHASGESISSFVAIPEIQVGKANNAQNIGAAITYFKRYALAAAFGISSDEDIDCSSQALESHNRASETTAPTVKNTSSKKSSVTPNKNISKDENNAPNVKKYTKEQAATLAELMNCIDPDGAAVFTDEEKASYKKMLINGEFEAAFTQAQNLVDVRTGKIIY